MKKIKLLQISEPGIGGVKRHVIELLNSLDLSVFDITYIYSKYRMNSSYENEIKILREKGVTCININIENNFSIYSTIKNLYKILENILVIRPDIIHSHSSFAGFLSRLATCFFSNNIVNIYTPHGMPYHINTNYKYIEKILSKNTDKLICTSRSEAKDILKRNIISENKIEVIPHRLLNTNKYPNIKKVDFNKKSYKVGACGRISYAKNALLFFKVAVELLKSYSNLEIIWIGDFHTDQESKEVKKFIRRNKLANKIKITGWVNNPNDFISGLDIFCMFSRYESFGYVTLDAMFLGIPIVATKSMGTKDLIKNNSTGILVNSNVKEIFDKISALINNKDMRSKISYNEKKYIKNNYVSDNNIKKIENLYKSSI